MIKADCQGLPDNQFLYMDITRVGDESYVIDTSGGDAVDLDRVRGWGEGVDNLTETIDHLDRVDFAEIAIDKSSCADVHRVRNHVNADVRDSLDTEREVEGNDRVAAIGGLEYGGVSAGLSERGAIEIVVVARVHHMVNLRGYSRNIVEMDISEGVAHLLSLGLDGNNGILRDIESDDAIAGVRFALTSVIVDGLSLSGNLGSGESVGYHTAGVRVLEMAGVCTCGGDKRINEVIGLTAADLN